MDAAEGSSGSAAADRRRVTKSRVVQAAPNCFRGLMTDKNTGEVSFTISLTELSAVLGGSLVLRARVAAEGGASRSVEPAESQPFSVV